MLSAHRESIIFQIDFSTSAKAAPVVQAVVQPTAKEGAAIGDDEEFIDDI